MPFVFSLSALYLIYKERKREKGREREKERERERERERKRERERERGGGGEGCHSDYMGLRQKRQNFLQRGPDLVTQKYVGADHSA